MENLADRMKSLLHGQMFTLLKRIGRLANADGYSAFVVGGLVRDMVMGTRNLDLDIVIEGDAIHFSGRLARRIGGTVVVHRRFGTASIYMKSGLKIDIATARREVYEAPAALPRVEFSSLRHDLIRRDFTINAMAVSLNRESFGQLIDFFGGERDLGQRRIRVLHDSSFIDDPTRIFRAVRFEQRFGFMIDSRTEELIRHAISREMFDRTEKQRIRDEIILILKEPDPLKALRRMNELHELKFIHPRIKFSKKMAKFFKSIEDVLGWFDASSFRRRPAEGWVLYLMALTDGLSRRELIELCEQFVLRNRDRARLLSFKASYRAVIGLLTGRRRAAPRSLHAALEPLSYETMLAILAGSGSTLARKRMEEFFRRYHGIKLSIKGGDLKRLGLKPGPKFSEILAGVLHRKIDGLVRTKKEELECAKALIRAMK